MNIIFHINGGIGKNIMATAVAEAIKKQYPDDGLVVVTGWPEVWLHNPHISRVYRHGNTPYFYEDLIKDKDVKVFAQEPYSTEGYIQKSEHLIESWCKLLNVKYNGEQTSLYLTAQEKKIAPFIGDNSKPTLVFQDRGGMPNDNSIPSWVRDIPTNQAIDLLKVLSQYYNVVRIKSGNVPDIEGIPNVTFSGVRELFSYVYNNNMFLVIDSSIQHIAKAFDKPAVVCWPVNNVKALGYNSHINIYSDRLVYDGTAHVDSYLGDFDIAGQPHQSLFQTDEVFDLEEILKLFIQQVETPQETPQEAPQDALEIVEAEETLSDTFTGLKAAKKATKKRTKKS